MWENVFLLFQRYFIAIRYIDNVKENVNKWHIYPRFTYLCWLLTLRAVWTTSDTSLSDSVTNSDSEVTMLSLRAALSGCCCALLAAAPRCCSPARPLSSDCCCCMSDSCGAWSSLESWNDYNMKTSCLSKMGLHQVQDLLMCNIRFKHRVAFQAEDIYLNFPFIEMILVDNFYKTSHEDSKWSNNGFKINIWKLKAEILFFLPVHARRSVYLNNYELFFDWTHTICGSVPSDTQNQVMFKVPNLVKCLIVVIQF